MRQRDRNGGERKGQRDRVIKQRHHYHVEFYISCQSFFTSVCSMVGIPKCSSGGISLMQLKSLNPWGIHSCCSHKILHVCNGCFLSHHLSWWEFCLDGLPRSASPGLASSYGCCLRFSHSLCSGILSNMLILNLSPLCMPEINTFLFAICGYLKFLLQQLILWELSPLTVFEKIHYAFLNPHTPLLVQLLIDFLFIQM